MIRTKTVERNFRVVVEPEAGWEIRSNQDVADAERRNAKVIADQINRHVDFVFNVEIKSDRVCAYCENDPEPHYETGEPFCCNEATKEWEALSGPKEEGR